MSSSGPLNPVNRNMVKTDGKGNPNGDHSERDNGDNKIPGEKRNGANMKTEYYRKLFNEYDKNKDGYLCLEDLKQVLHMQGRTDITDDDIKEMIFTVSNIQNDRIAFDRFPKLMNAAPWFFQVEVPGRNKFIHLNVLSIPDDDKIMQNKTSSSIASDISSSDSQRDDLMVTDAKDELNKREIKGSVNSLFNLNSCKTLLAGGVAGAISRTMVSPLERLKILYQTQNTFINSPGSSTKYHSVSSSLRLMYKEEGLKGYFKGNGVNCLRIFPANACQFFFYDLYKKMIPLKQGRAELTPFQRLLAGGLAGITGLVITYPLDFIRAYLSVQTSKQTPSMSFVCRHVFHNHGYLGFYKGLWPSILGVVPYVGIDFAVYDILKRNAPQRSDGSMAPYVTLSCGAIAGSLAQTVAYPLDLVRRRIQVQTFSSLLESETPEKMDSKNTTKIQMPYRSMTDAFIKIHKQEGFGGFYKGLWPNYLKVVPAISISFLVFENLKKILNIKTTQK